MSKYTAVNILKKDKPRFDALAGENRVRWMTSLLDRETCKHPAKARQLLSIADRADGEALSAEEPQKNITLNGYYCKACGQYIFPKPVL